MSARRACRTAIAMLVAGCAASPEHSPTTSGGKPPAGDRAVLETVVEYFLEYREPSGAPGKFHGSRRSGHRALVHHTLRPLRGWGLELAGRLALPPTMDDEALAELVERDEHGFAPDTYEHFPQWVAGDVPAITVVDLEKFSWSVPSLDRGGYPEYKVALSLSWPWYSTDGRWAVVAAHIGPRSPGIHTATATLALEHDDGSWRVRDVLFAWPQ